MSYVPPPSPPSIHLIQRVEIINSSDHEIALSITRCIPQIAQCIDMIVPRVRGGGRVIYVGAGTSGRLGVLDASEIPPTFSSPDIFHAIIAGTDLALRNAIEGAEDTPFEFPSSLSPLTSTDTLIGIATSGRTPYVLSALSYARARGALALGLAFVSPSEMRERGGCEAVAECAVGGEVLMGSTRMKAGSGTKMILNMISTGVMIRLGEGTGWGWGGLRGAWGDLPVDDVEVVGEEVGSVTLGHEVALGTLKSLIDEDVSSYTAASASDSEKPTGPRRKVKVKFAAAWIGGAGLDRVDDVRSVKGRIAGLLGMVGEEDKVVVSSDAVLLGAAISSPHSYSSSSTSTSPGTSPATSSATSPHTLPLTSPPTSTIPGTSPQTSPSTSPSTSLTTPSETQTPPETTPTQIETQPQPRTATGAVLILGTGSIASSFSLSLIP
ncbi:hypothetical protein BDQ17DRAFT_1436311 [Cyathus striatus]|nr:hypothetical protein BDQ17DRAFT_1436311 [Cyathus striatus]